MTVTPLIDQYDELIQKVMQERPPLMALVREHGHAFEPTEWKTWRGRGYRRGREKQCYKNAADLALRHDAELTYCEGLAVRMGAFTVEHAWCVTEDGRVVDPTWREKDAPPVSQWEYLGIPFTKSGVLEVILDKMTYGLLEGEIVHDGRFDPLWIPERWRR